MGELGGYAGLRSAKAALEEGVITAVDYEEVKTAFLRAQQIRAGLDAGFIRETDYQNIKRAFLNSLNLADPSFAPGNRFASSGAQSSEQDAPHIPTAPRPAAIGAAPELPNSSSVPAAPQPPASASTGQVPQTHEMQETRPANATNGLSSKFSAPTNVPKVGSARAKPTGGTSMSGISVLDDAVNLYYYLKAKSAYKWIVWKINAAGDQVVIDSAGPSDSTYNEFLSVLPPTDCRYAVVDMQFTNSDGCVFNKILFINWAPDTAKMRSKMMYASTKDFFKGYLDGISNEIQAGDLTDCAETEAQSAVRSSVTRQ